jgi:hypothetical protein
MVLELFKKMPWITGLRAMAELTMVTLGWVLASVFFFFFCMLFVAFHEKGKETLFLNQFIFAMLVDEIIYDNHRQKYLKWLDAQPAIQGDWDIPNLMGALPGARNMGVDFIEHVGDAASLLAILRLHRNRDS